MGWFHRMHLSMAVPGVNSGGATRTVPLLSLQDACISVSCFPGQFNFETADCFCDVHTLLSADSTPAEESIDGNKKKKKLNVSLTFPKHFGAWNCKKERDREGKRQKGEEQGEKWLNRISKEIYKLLRYQKIKVYRHEVWQWSDTTINWKFSFRETFKSEITT